MSTPNAAFINTVDDDYYDTENMRIDDRNGNFSPDQVEDYQHKNIVFASLRNGQFQQAREQCVQYGLDYTFMTIAAGVYKGDGYLP